MPTTRADDRLLDVADLETTASLLQQWALAQYGAGAAVAAVKPMPGHAGISFGFDVTTGSNTDRLVVRVAPPGLRRSGPTDVLRQVPVLRTARLAGVPVPEVRWWSDDERWFGSPFFMVECLAGGSLSCWEPLDADPCSVRPVFDQAVSALATLQTIDWRTQLPGWSEPRTLEAEVRAWQLVLVKGQNSDWTERAMVLHDLLLQRIPAEPDAVVVHGDFYSNNWVCDGDRLLGIVDWELAAVGPPLLDLAWLMMIYDPTCWGPTRHALMGWSPDPAEIASAYAAASGRSLANLTWYRALVSWRFACITALNVRLHRTGRRPDETWELIAEAFDPLVSRGCEFLLSVEASQS
jgi:aminoglycoside phosphotransferase (APT) family kinase protein